MFQFGISSKNVFSKGVALAVGVAGLLFIGPQSGFGAGTSVDPASLGVGFRQMYNLDFTAAHKTFEAWQQAHPEDPLGAASNAAAYLFAEFDRLRILDLDSFVQDSKLEKVDQLPPDPNMKAAFEGELARADGIAATVLAQSPNDRNALFAKSFIDGLRGTYAALVEKKKRDALSFLKASRLTAEKLIAIDPAYYDAYLAVGIENYLLGLRSAPTRWVLRLSGAQTSKEKGIANVRTTAEKGSYLAPYARLLLVIACLRDQDQRAAKKLLADLVRDFPQNRLYQVELARLHS